jgi:DNA ligase-3
MKRDHLYNNQLSDTVDLLVLGGYYGTGAKGGMLSVFLMGVYDEETQTYKTVTKCGNGHDDATLLAINQQLVPNHMTRIKRDPSLLPPWLDCARRLTPDWLINDPTTAPVWEIIGAEFSTSDTHTAKGISIRFPRVLRVRTDKTTNEATTLSELVHLMLHNIA